MALKRPHFAKKAGVRHGAVRRVASQAGGYDGTLSSWHVRRTDFSAEGQERGRIAARASDLALNDPHAASTIDSMALGTVGTGIMPQSVPNTVRLGWTEAQGVEFSHQAEAAFADWSAGVDPDGTLPFWALQYTSIHSLLVQGEFFRLPVMVDNDRFRPLSLAVQSIHASRVVTPADLESDPAVRDGVRIDPLGRVLSYYVFNPDADRCVMSDDPGGQPSTEFANIRRRVGHRPGILHGFVRKTDEQFRGVSVLAPAMKFFRDLSDYLDYELVGAIVAASFPVFIESTMPGPGAYPGQPGRTQADRPPRKELNVAPGQIMYGSAGERPHVLNSNRPGNSFPVFVERLIRAVGASVGMPYEVVAKDFSQTNYSSARAALLEAWRMFGFYQRWLVDSLCRPLWRMVIEEAWLRGLIVLPKKTDFYANMAALCRSEWIPPRRGFVDPAKEIEAYSAGVDNDMLTLAMAIMELTGQDYETVLAQRGREERLRAESITVRREKNKTVKKTEEKDESTPVEIA